MPRPLIDTAALRANILAAMDSEPDDKTVFKPEGKRKAEEALNGVSPKRLKVNDAEQDEEGRIERILNDISPERLKVDEAAQNEKEKTVCFSY